MTRRRCAASILVGLLALALPMPAHAAPKSDVVTLLNGNQITGEVMGLTRGKLDYKTDDIGRLSIEWVKVALVRSVHIFDVETASGARYFGRLGATEETGTIAVYGVTADTLQIANVVGMAQVDAGFMQRVMAYLDLGFTYAKANQATTLTTDGEVAYRGPKYGGAFSFDSYGQAQENVAASNQYTVVLKGTRYLQKRWSTSTLVQADHNDELNLILRLSGGAGGGRVLHQSNQSEVSAGAGLVVAREEYSPTESGTGVGNTTQTSLEARFGAGWDAFRFDSPKLDFSTTLEVYPSLSTIGRVRGAFNTRLKYELFTDFNAGINFSDSFDSRPPEEDASHNDFILSFTIGWSYRR
jgi:Protein of unknown function, DUF481